MLPAVLGLLLTCVIAWLVASFVHAATSAGAVFGPLFMTVCTNPVSVLHSFVQTTLPYSVPSPLQCTPSPPLPAFEMIDPSRSAWLLCHEPLPQNPHTPTGTVHTVMDTFAQPLKLAFCDRHAVHRLCCTPAAARQFGVQCYKSQITDKCYTLLYARKPSSFPSFMTVRTHPTAFQALTDELHELMTRLCSC
jgi:hypothetical protein